MCGSFLGMELAGWKTGAGMKILMGSQVWIGHGLLKTCGLLQFLSEGWRSSMFLPQSVIWVLEQWHQWPAKCWWGNLCSEFQDPGTQIHSERPLDPTSSSYCKSLTEVCLERFSSMLRCLSSIFIAIFWLYHSPSSPIEFHLYEIVREFSYVLARWHLRSYGWSIALVAVSSTTYLAWTRHRSILPSIRANGRRLIPRQWPFLLWRGWHFFLSALAFRISHPHSWLSYSLDQEEQSLRFLQKL